MQTSARRLALPVLFSTLLLVAWTRSAPQEVEMKVQHVAGAVHMIEGRGGNLGVSVGEDGLLLVDDQFANLAAAIQVELDALAKGAGLDTGEPRFLVNTHHHGDHTGGNAVFGETATILAHENVRARLLEPARGEPTPAAGLPVVTYAQGLSLHFNGEEVRVWHLPHGHTDGDSVVHFTGSNAVHTGDLCFNGRFPYIDVTSGGSVAGYIEAVAAILAATDARTRYIPGHGALASREDVETFHRRLDEIYTMVKGAHDQGMDAAGMKRDKLLADYDDWSWNFVDATRMIDMIVQELEG